MIQGLGVDLVDISRLERALERWGQRFLQRVFTSGEIERCLHRARPGSCLAVRFAAKEAFGKALGLGMQQGLRWRDIEIAADNLGKPGLKLHNQAQRLLARIGAEKTWVSLADEGGFAIAVVILERRSSQEFTEGDTRR